MMEYLFKNQITNVDIRVQNKVRYFADFFELTVTNYGRFGYPDLESHCSLLEKIMFRLEHFGKKNTNRYLKYIKQYLGNRFFAPDDSILKDHYPDLLVITEQLKEDLLTTPADCENYINQLAPFVVKLKEELFLHSLESLNTILHCTKDLEKHDHIRYIEYYTAIMSAELTFKGFPEKDTKKIFDKILSNEVKVSKNKLRTEFPLPPELLAKQSMMGLAEYQKEVESFMNTRTLKQQFEGLGNLYRAQASPSRVLFRIKGLKSIGPVEKVYGNVKLTNNHQAYQATEMNQNYRDFFAVEHALYIEATVNADDMIVAETMALDSIRKELPRFERYFNNKISVDYSDIVHESNGSFQIKFSFAHRWLRDGNEELETLEMQMLELDSPAAKDFLHLDTLFATARSAEIPAQKLNHSWQYLESTFLDQGLSGEEVINWAGDIIAQYNMCSISMPLQVDLINIIWSNADLGIQTSQGFFSYNDLRKIIDEVVIDTQWLIEKSNQFDSPYVSHHLQKYLSKSVSELLEALKLHYRNLLREVYEQRNYIQHSGISHPLALKKLSYVLPSMTEMFRYALSEEILKNELTNISDVLEKLRLPYVKISKLIDAKALFPEL